MAASAKTNDTDVQWVSVDDVQRMIDDQLAEMRANHEAQISDLQQQIASAQQGFKSSPVPEHSGGPGLEIAETWSQYEQGQAKLASES